ncbi:unnamed protein product [Oikopleura dioica]|uniref:Uncharacterized protein n=1 Tax=Oikopleura dioica TaxID=34765 RepID=E4XDM0_OIKDI|nr:unnamed protein product [Oikopleura dioica]
MAKSDWEVVKDSKKKPAAKESPDASASQKAKKVTPKAVITATGDNKSNGSKKPVKKGPPKRQPFELTPETTDELVKSTSIFDAANLLGVSLVAPESIPPYSHEDFPMNKLTKPVKEVFDKLFGRLKREEDQKALLAHVMTNLINSSRRAENAWGWRCVGQMLVRKYPKVADISEDVLGTETHPGAVLSIIFMLFESTDPKALFSVLENLVYSRLNMKKVAEVLSKLSNKLKAALKESFRISQSKIIVAPANYSALIAAASDSKLNKNVQTELEQLAIRTRLYIKPDEKWVEELLSHMCTGRQGHALPILLLGIENRPAQCAQKLKALSSTHRLQVQYVLDSVPESTLSSKYRSIVEKSLTEPVTATASKSKAKSPAKAQKSSQAICGKVDDSSCFLLKLPTYIMYFLLLTSLSSQFECTRPLYNQHFKQYYDAYIIPKYDEYVNPHVQEFIIPAYKQYGHPQVNKVQELFAAHGQPQVDKLQKLYNAHLKDHVDTTITSLNEQVQKHVVPTVQNVQKELEPYFNNAMKNGTIMVKQLREQANVLAENWGVVCERWIAQMRVQIDTYSALARDETLKGLAKLQRASKEYANSALTNTEEYRQQASIKLTEAQSFVLERFETAILVIQKQVPVVHEFLLEYNLDKIFTNIFEGIGRSVLWTGDLIGKLAAGRFCCAQSQIMGLGNQIYDFGLLAYNQIANFIQN